MVYSTIDFAESLRFLRRAHIALTAFVVRCSPRARAARAAHGLLGGNANSASGARGVLGRMSILT